MFYCHNLAQHSPQKEKMELSATQKKDEFLVSHQLQGVHIIVSREWNELSTTEYGFTQLPSNYATGSTTRAPNSLPSVHHAVLFTHSFYYAC